MKSQLVRFRAAGLMPWKRRLKDEDVNWVVNSLGELGVEINGQFFFLYKGHSLCYRKNDDLGAGGKPLQVRRVGKREFGETCKPPRYDEAEKDAEGRYAEEVTPGIGTADYDIPPEYKWHPLFP